VRLATERRRRVAGLADLWLNYPKQRLRTILHSPRLLRRNLGMPGLGA
jgi:hypothetical protein